MLCYRPTRLGFLFEFRLPGFLECLIRFEAEPLAALLALAGLARAVRRVNYCVCHLLARIVWGLWDVLRWVLEQFLHDALPSRVRLRLVRLLCRFV